MNRDLLSTLFAPPREDGRFYGVTIGVVTNNKFDKDEGMAGAVKVRFPYLSDSDESHWARVLSPMAGKERGIYFLPEVDDEVLVAFEQGCLDHPYVLGALWNGVDKPPEVNEDGKNNIRIIKSRSGHTISLDDTKDAGMITIKTSAGHTISLDDTKDKEALKLIDKSGKNSIAIDSKKNTLTIKCDGDVKVESKGKLAVKGKSIAFDGNTKIKGDVEINGNVDIK